MFSIHCGLKILHIVKSSDTNNIGTFNLADIAQKKSARDFLSCSNLVVGILRV